MNQAQRNFLIKKIEENLKIQDNALRESEPDCPNIHNYLLHAVMSGNFQLRTTEELKATILDKALNAGSRTDNWLAKSAGMFSATKDVHLTVNQLFVIPEEYKIKYDIWKAERDRINQKRVELSAQCNNLIIRIQLASDKTLQTMINEVDDMGNLSLIDTKLKAISNT
jgi:hypothetical protein